MVKTVKAKFIILVLAIVIVGTGFPTLFFLEQLKENFQQRSFAMLDVTLDVLKSSLINGITSGVNSSAQNIINNVARNKHINRIRIVSPAGKVLCSSKPSENGKPLNDVAHSHAKILSNSRFGNDDFEIRANGSYVALHAIYNKNYCQNCHLGKNNILAYFDVDTKMTMAELNFYTGTFHSIFFGIAILLLIVLGLYITYYKLINAPLKYVMNGLDEVGSGNLDIYLETNENEEFRIINKHFNTMVSSMKKAKEKIEEMSFKELEHTDKLATIGQLTAEISHEINNPAAIIMSRADYLIMEASDEPMLKKYSEDFEAIYAQTERISTITKNVLKYSHKLPKEFSKMELKEVVKNALAILKLRLAKKGVVVNERYFSESCILGNAVQIEQVVINILQNGIDALGQGGELTIEISEENKKAILRISDNGHGMDESTKQKIFAPFFTTKPVNVGTGLGMFITDKICKNHNAKIICISEVNVGTTFKIIFDKYKGE